MVNAAQQSLQPTQSAAEAGVRPTMDKLDKSAVSCRKADGFVLNEVREQGDFVIMTGHFEGPHGIGSTQRAAAQNMGRDLEATNEYIVWDTTNQIVFKTLNSPSGLRKE